MEAVRNCGWTVRHSNCKMEASKGYQTDTWMEKYRNREGYSVGTYILQKYIGYTVRRQIEPVWRKT